MSDESRAATPPIPDKSGVGSDVFGGYAAFYDSLYGDKDYDAECDFLERMFDRFARRGVRTILDLGCGTGGHDIPLATRGFDVVGVDRSSEMVAQAREKAHDLGLGPAAEFVENDVRELDMGRTFDAVISMFAVISYQTADDDLAGMLRVARRHLAADGLFIFDGWFGPAVLAQEPEEKRKDVPLPGGETIKRTAVPRHDASAHTVTVDYRVERWRDEELVDVSRESHVVRYLFPAEIGEFLAGADFELLALGPFLDVDRSPTDLDWNVSVVAKAGKNE